MNFYEIHEGTDDLGTAVLLAHKQAIDPLEFFGIVKKARALVLDSFEEDTLAEAIANELERSAGFIHVRDERLLASVNVDETEERTFLVTEGPGDRTVIVSRDATTNENGG